MSKFSEFLTSGNTTVVNLAEHAGKIQKALDNGEISIEDADDLLESLSIVEDVVHADMVDNEKQQVYDALKVIKELIGIIKSKS